MKNLSLRVYTHNNLGYDREREQVAQNRTYMPYYLRRDMDDPVITFQPTLSRLSSMSVEDLSVLDDMLWMLHKQIERDIDELSAADIVKEITNE